jgi:hypothetical protein
MTPPLYLREKIFLSHFNRIALQNLSQGNQPFSFPKVITLIPAERTYYNGSSNQRAKIIIRTVGKGEGYVWIISWSNTVIF